MVNEPGQDSWMPGHSAGKGQTQSGNVRGQESWSHIPTNAVNWMRIRYRTKLAGLALVAMLLTGILIYIWIITWGNKTQLVIIQPGKVKSTWLATTPYMNALTRDSLTPNAEYLKPVEGLDLLDPESNDWKKQIQKQGFGFGGPDGQVLLYYVNAVGVASALDEEDTTDANLVACTLPADSSPFDSDREIKRYSLEALLDQIVACDSSKPGTIIVLVDSHPLTTPSNPGLLADHFPQAVHDLYERKYKKTGDGTHRLVVVCSHSPGQRNWPAPELDASVFGFFTRAALLGAADGATGNGQDNKITFEEFCQYLAFHVSGHVRKFRMATQTPMILAPASLETGPDNKGKSDELAIVYLESSSASAKHTTDSGRIASERISRLTEKYRLSEKWKRFAELESSNRLDRDPVLGGRAAAVLSRMEQLICEMGIDAEELVALDSEWTDLLKSLDSPVNWSPVSLAEAEWLAQQQERNANVSGSDSSSRMPNRDMRKSLQQTLSSWVESVRLAAEKPKVDPAVPGGEVASTNDDKTGTDPEEAPVPSGAEEPDAVAVDANAKADELKKRLLEIESQPWLIAAMLWDGACRNEEFSPGSDNLDYWLTKLDVVNTRESGGLPVNEFIEMKFLHLLQQNVDWNYEPAKLVVQTVRRAIQCRDACENFATNVDPRVLVWVSDEFRTLEDTRRIAEDHLFANQFDIANQLFDRVIQHLGVAQPESLNGRARALANAFTVRNEVARKSPHFAMLIARQILRNETTDQEVPSGVDFAEFRDRWLALAQLNHQLAYELWRPSTGIEEAVTAELILNNTEHILKLAQEVKSALDFLEGQTGKHRDFLADIKSDDIQAMVYIPDLLLSPLVTNRREEIRARYLKSISGIAADPGSGQRVQASAMPSSGENQIRFADFLRAADVVNQQDYFTPAQRSVSARPYRKYWDTTRISVDIVDQIGKEIWQGLDRAESLTTRQSALQNADYWVRCVASGLADYQGRFADLTDQSGHYFHVLGRTGSWLTRTGESLHTNLKVERILDDFWGNNRIADSSDPYFQRVAARIYDRIEDDHRKFLDVTLTPLFASRLNSAKEFQIICGDYSYLRNETIKPPHAFSIRAKTELEQRIQVNGQDWGPVAVAQLQGLGRRLSPAPVTLDAIHESGPTAERRVVYDLDKLRTGDVPNQLFNFPEESLPDLGNVQAILSFRGHLADARFNVRALDQPPDEFLSTITLTHNPSTWRPPTVLVKSNAQAVTNVVFVLDCSASMSGSFSTGEIEGLEGSMPTADPSMSVVTNTTRFDFLKDAIKERLKQMRTSQLNRVGIVAVGSRVYFRSDGKRALNELEFSGSDLEVIEWKADGVRPNNDADVVSKLTSTGVWTDREWSVIEKSIDKLKPFGQTPLYAGIVKAAQMLNADGNSQSKVIVVISDGVEEVYEFRGGIPELDETSSTKNFDELKRSLPDAGIELFFIGFDLANDQSASAKVQKNRLNRIRPDLFSSRLEQIESLAKEKYYPNQIQRFREDIEKIARATGFDVFFGRERLANEKLNHGWQPASIEEFKAGYYDISIQDSPASTTFWLEDGEFVTLEYDGSSLSFAKDKNVGANVIHSNEQVLGKNPYTISLFQPNLQKPDMIPFEFGFERNPDKEFSFRPNRLCLEILPESPADASPNWFLQDYRFANKPDQNGPVVQFSSPGLPRGSYNLRLWSKPFQENEGSPTGRTSLSASHLNGKAGALKQEQKIGAENVTVEAWGEPAERSITIRITSPNRQILRTLLVDLLVDDPPAKARSGRDFLINRVFAEPVLVPGSVENPDSKSLFVEHSFFVDKRYHSSSIHFVVQPMESVFGESDFADFPFRKN